MSGLFDGLLDNQTIRKRLLVYPYPEKYHPSEKFIDSIIQEFWFHDFYQSLITIPRFYDYLQEFLLLKKPKSFVRSEFYEFFFKKIIRNYVEDDEVNSWFDKLKVISCVFEKLQTDTISVSLYEKIIRKDIHIDNEMFSPDWLVSNQLASIIENKEGKNIRWIHHSLTEFLTSEYILHLPDPIETTFSYIIIKKDGFEALKPSWYGVLRFLLESNITKELTGKLIIFLNRRDDVLDNDLSDLLSRVNPEEIGPLKDDLFKLIYESYFKNQLWIPVWTGNLLGRFCNKKNYENLKRDLRVASNEVKTYVHRGNVISLIRGMIENSNGLITKVEKQYWKNKCIEFANDSNENGVLQRRSLDVLENFVGEADIIDQVAEKTFSHPSSLVREAFIAFCSQIDPNSSTTIKYLVEGIKKGITIYGRYGLYKITKKEAILELLGYFISDNNFLAKFLDSESIFSADRNKGDKELIQHIEEVADDQVVVKLKEITMKYSQVESGYFMERSAFFKHIVKIIQKFDESYLYEVIGVIKKETKENRSHKIIEYEPLLSFLITLKNLKQFYKEMKGIDDDWKRWVNSLVYHANNYGGETGKLVYEKARKLKIVEPLRPPKYYEDLEIKKKTNIYNEFVKKLGTKKSKKYFLDVFKYYLNNRDEIEKHWTKIQKERLVWITTVDSLDRIDPKEFKVTIPNKSGDNRQFTWTRTASYFGDLIGVLKILAPAKISEYRQKIINFIPYAYSDDQQMILEQINIVTEKELEFVTKVYLNKRDDRRYLETSSYIYLIKEFKRRGSILTSPPEVLKSFMDDRHIRDHEKLSTLETLSEFMNSKDNEMRTYLTTLFENNKNSTNRSFTSTINAILIKNFQDKKAINWRFKEIKKKISFKRSEIGIVHEVGANENEIDYLYFAKALIELKDIKYIPRFLSLLKYSFSILENDRNKEYWEYVNYLWKIVTTYFDGLKYQGSFKPLVTLKRFIKTNTKGDGSNWLKSRLEELTKSYINAIP